MRQNAADRSYSGDQYPDQDLTREIIGAFYCVYHRFGFGFLESVYRRAMVVELQFRHIAIHQEVPFALEHRGVMVGTYRADLVAEGRVIVEAKSGLSLDPTSSPQLLNYLSAAKLQVGLILHFGPRPTVKRMISSRIRAENLTPHLGPISEMERRRLDDRQDIS